MNKIANILLVLVEIITVFFCNILPICLLIYIIIKAKWILLLPLLLSVFLWPAIISRILALVMLIPSAISYFGLVVPILKYPSFLISSLLHSYIMSYCGVYLLYYMLANPIENNYIFTFFISVMMILSPYYLMIKNDESLSSVLYLSFFQLAIFVLMVLLLFTMLSFNESLVLVMSVMLIPAIMNFLTLISSDKEF